MFQHSYVGTQSPKTLKLLMALWYFVPQTTMVISTQWLRHISRQFCAPSLSFLSDRLHGSHIWTNSIWQGTKSSNGHGVWAPPGAPNVPDDKFRCLNMCFNRVSYIRLVVKGFEYCVIISFCIQTIRIHNSSLLQGRVFTIVGYISVGKHPLLIPQ